MGLNIVDINVFLFNFYKLSCLCHSCTFFDVLRNIFELFLHLCAVHGLDWTGIREHFEGRQQTTQQLNGLHYDVFTGCLWRHEFSSRLPPWCTLLLINAGQHTSTISSISTQKKLDVAISVPLQPTQLLSWGHGPSLGSAPSPSAVQVGLIWNQIPPHIRNLHSVPAFRKAPKTYLFSEII